jgi:DNA-directed RNA polymerase specialized sigma24 family protein
MGPTDETRFLALLHEHRAILYKVAFGYCRNREDRVAMNVAISHFRADVRRVRDTLPISELAYELAADDPLAEEAGDNMRVRRRLIDGLDQLNRALVLLYLEGYTSEEIAEIVGISPGNVTTRVNRVNRVKHELQRGFARLENS